METQAMQEFQELCLACRVGDLETVDVLISTGINVNRMDEWNYSPLILASLCGHKDIVQLLLDRGNARCDRDTFEGQRCIYGALTNEIRNILIRFDISKTLNLSNQPFASYLSSLVKNLNRTSDIMFNFEHEFDPPFKLHRFMLMWRSSYFMEKIHGPWFDKLQINMPPVSEPETFQFIVDYIYLVPCLDNLGRVDAGVLDKFAKKLGFNEILEIKEELSQIPYQDSVMQIKCKNKFQLKIEDNAKIHMNRLLDEIIKNKEIVLNSDISDYAKASFFTSNVCPDIIVYIETLEGYKIYYPCHRAILCKSQYFETMFNSSFHETTIYQELLTKDDVIDRVKFPPSAIPVISLTSINREDLAEILLTYLYMDQVDISPSVAIDVMIVADLLFIDRLKTAALISLTKLTEFDEISIYDILRTGWQTRVHRLETFAAQQFANNLAAYIDTEEFEDIVLESAERIELRQETDSIELIDDMRFYLLKKYSIDLNDELGVEYDMDDMIKYENDLAKIDELLDKLQLDA